MMAIRIQNIPPEWKWDNLIIALTTLCNDETPTLAVSGTLMRAADLSLKSQVAIVQFHDPIPNFLKTVLEDGTGDTIAHKHVNGINLQFDRNFWGITPLLCPDSDNDISMDIVAVTGLDGHAYGSWASRNVSSIWLRDFLKDDLPNCRVLTFGYNTKLSVDSNYRLEDFCKELLGEIGLARSSKIASSRPLVLIGHSYGTRLITQCLCQCKLSDDPDLNAILTSTRAVVFFGAVHRGMDITDIQRYLRDILPESSIRFKIVEELRMNNEAASKELQNFIDLLPRFLVISIYERRQTRKLVKQEPVSESEPAEASTAKLKAKIWKRVGEPYTPVTESSSVLGLPVSLEITIPSDSDHSNITKFSSQSDSVYRELLKRLRKIQAEVDLKEFPYTQLLRVDPVDKWYLYPNPSLSDGQQTTTVMDKDTGLSTNDIQLLPASTLLRVATCLVQDLCSNSIFSAADLNLLERAGTMMRTTRYYLTLLNKISNGMEVDTSKQIETRMTILKLRQSLIDLVNVLDPITCPLTPDLFGSQIHHRTLSSTIISTLKEMVNTLEDGNKQLERLTESSVGGSSLSSSLVIPNTKAETLARMATIWSRNGQSTKETVTWIPFEYLHFAVGSISESSRYQESWVQQVIKMFTKTEAIHLRLRARRFGVLDYKGHLERVMVEFRPYPANARASNQQQRPAVEDYEARKWAVASLARMLLSSISSPQTPGSRFPCVPFRYLSDMSNSSTPSFALIYSAEGLYALHEMMQKDWPRPSIAQRVHLVLSYAWALASLHVADMVHGGFNADNLYLRFPQAEGGEQDIRTRSIAEAEALLSGFETTRSFGGMTDSLDVEDPDLRAYLHPDRLAPGSQKKRQQPSHDLFGLGMIMIEIGQWGLLRSLPEYPKPWETDKIRQQFCRSRRRCFEGETTAENLGSLYGGIIAFCFNKGKDPLIGQDGNKSEPKDDDSLGAWKTLRVVELVQECARCVGVLTPL